MKAVVDSKGRFTIPQEILKLLRIKDKSFLQLDINVETKQIILTPLRGKYKGKGLMQAFTTEKNKNSD